MQTIPYPTEWKKYYVDTPSGADYSTCPICYQSCYCCNQDTTSEICSIARDLDENSHYCGNCCILYGIGCCYSCQGCTDDIWYGKLIDSFEYNGVEYKGQPKFLCDEVERSLKMGKFEYKLKRKIPRDFKGILRNMKNIKFKCTCFLTGCETNKKAYYPRNSFPQYYTCRCLVRK